MQSNSLNEGRATSQEEVGLRQTSVLSSSRDTQTMKDEMAGKVLKRGSKPKKSVRRRMAALIGENTPLMTTQYRNITAEDVKKYKLPKKYVGKQITGCVVKVKIGKVRVH